jgi:hypothetical protein
MRLPDKVKFLLVLCAGLIFFIPGCVDTSVQSIAPVDQRSQVTFVNVVAGAGDASFTIDGKSVSAGFGTETAMFDIPAGNKNISVNFSGGSTQTYSFSTDVDFKMRIFFIGTSSSSDAERFTLRSVGGSYSTNADSALVSFFNGSPESTLDGLIVVAGTDTQEVAFDNSVAFGDMSDQMLFLPGNYKVGLMYNDSLSTAPTNTVNINANTRYTAITYEMPSNMKLNVLTDN